MRRSYSSLGYLGAGERISANTRKACSTACRLPWRRARRLHSRITNSTLSYGLCQDGQPEEFVDAVPSVLLRDDKINFELTNVLGPPLKNAVERLLETCIGDILPEGFRKQRLIACYRTIWCLRGLGLRHTKDLLETWRSSRRDSVKGEWDVLCFEAWKAA